MRIALTLFAPPLLAGCATISSARPAEGPARLGQPVYVDGVTVQPTEVIEDSRYPAAVMCVWAGRVVVRATVSGGQWRRTLDLETGKPVSVAAGALTLIAVTPAKGEQGDYRFTFRFDGGI